MRWLKDVGTTISVILMSFLLILSSHGCKGLLLLLLSFKMVEKRKDNPVDLIFH